MASKKRARQLARAKHERQMQRRAERRARRRAMSLLGVAIGALVAAVVVIFVVLRSGSPAAAPGENATPSAPVETPTGVTCAEATPTSQTKTYASAGDERLRPGATITFDTNCGPITVDLDVKKAPQTTNAIAFLADTGWYNGNGCHRVTTEGIFVLQCGSPTLDGKGGPGFKIPDENLPKDVPDNYPAGTVAMANSGPGTGGSQIFFVYRNTTLPADYSILGHVSTGLDVVRYVASKGVRPGSEKPGDGQPAQTLVIESTSLGRR